ncbi:hypothetical protein ACH0BF_20495 [Pseudobacillus sp. 179-B 2D1 NHS]|uniref:hypothetical protein n=1 Tax=Pseudobacillus sp. 179-B 2D1 NHS TaxID=3374292 RepID=UPI0038795476
MVERIEKLEMKYENLEKMMSMVDEYSRHMMSQTFAVLGIVIAITTAILVAAAYFMIKTMINNKIDKEIDKRMITLLQSNPAVFHASGTAVPDANNKIYLNTGIEGINQLQPDNVLILDVSSQGVTISELSGGPGVIPRLRVNENGIVELEILNYHPSQGEVSWKILWPRIEYTT